MCELCGKFCGDTCQLNLFPPMAFIKDPKESHIDDLLCELTELSCIWKKNKEKGRPVTHIRAAMLDIISDIKTFQDARLCNEHS